jgi:hypothetical protein
MRMKNTVLFVPAEVLLCGAAGILSAGGGRQTQGASSVGGPAEISAKVFVRGTNDGRSKASLFSPYNPYNFFLALLRRLLGLIRLLLALIRLPLRLMSLSLGLMRLPLGLIRHSLGLIRLPLALMRLSLAMSNLSFYSSQLYSRHIQEALYAR